MAVLEWCGEHPWLTLLGVLCIEHLWGRMWDAFVSMRRPAFTRSHVPVVTGKVTP